MTIKEIHERLQGAASQQETYGPQLSNFLYEICSTNTPNSSVRPIEWAGEQLDVTQASTAGDGDPSLDDLAITTSCSDVHNPAAPERDYATCDCQAFCSVPRTTSQDHLISIIDDALGLISETCEEKSE